MVLHTYLSREIKGFFYGRARQGRNALPAGLEWQCFLAGAKRASSIKNICNVLEFLQHQLSRYEKDHASQICARLFCGI